MALLPLRGGNVRGTDRHAILLEFDISAYAVKNKSGTKFKVSDVLLTVRM
jgi:hypothetical protein